MQAGWIWWWSTKSGSWWPLQSPASSPLWTPVNQELLCQGVGFNICHPSQLFILQGALGFSTQCPWWTPPLLSSTPDWQGGCEGACWQNLRKEGDTGAGELDRFLLLFHLNYPGWLWFLLLLAPICSLLPMPGLSACCPWPRSPCMQAPTGSQACHWAQDTSGSKNHWKLGQV